MRFLPALLLALAVASCAPNDGALAPIVQAMGIGRFADNPAAPDLKLRSLGGDVVDLATYRGQVVLVNFWASWCAPCAAEWPSLVALRRSLGDAPGVKLLAVDLSEADDVAQGFVDAHGAGLTVLLDSDGAVGSTYNIQSLPTTLVVDSKGRVVAGVVGKFAWDKPEVLAGLKQLAALP